MNWDEIMKMDNQYEALKSIEAKCLKENLPVKEMMDRTEQYAKIHRIAVDDMAFYPNGERVLNH